MNKGLEALKRMYFHSLDLDLSITSDDYDIIEKALKALEIIKEKSVNVFYLKNTNSAEEYNIGLDLAKAWRLTQGEFDLLKKVLE